MSRSLKKGPYINLKLEKKVLAMNESGKKTVVKTCASLEFHVFSSAKWLRKA